MPHVDFFNDTPWVCVGYLSWVSLKK
jgi:hypothetical protein